MAKSSDSAWERFGRTDPYFGVLTEKRFHRSRLDDDSRSDFFASGRDHVDSVLATIRRRVDGEFVPRSVLDFGCGVGRLLLPLADQCDRVVGVDVSESMLAEARRNCDAAGASFVELAKSDDELSMVEGDFDLIHSVIVFQHIPPRRGLTLLARLLEHLAPGGVGVLHFTYRRQQRWKRVLYRVFLSVPGGRVALNVRARQPWNQPLMQMNSYDLNQVLSTVQAAGCPGAYVEFTDESGHLGAQVVFQRPPAE